MSTLEAGRRVEVRKGDVMTGAEVRDRETEVGRREARDAEMLRYWL